MRNVFLTVVEKDKNGPKRSNRKIRTRNKQLSKFVINRLTIDCNDQFEVLPILKTETLSRPQEGLKTVLDHYIPTKYEDQIKSVNILNFTNDKSSSIITREICKKELAYIRSPSLYFNTFTLEQVIVYSTSYGMLSTLVIMRVLR